MLKESLTRIKVKAGIKEFIAQCLSMKSPNEVIFGRYLQPLNVETVRALIMHLLDRNYHKLSKRHKSRNALFIVQPVDWGMKVDEFLAGLSEILAEAFIRGWK